MLIVGYILALLIGVILGLVGGGGSMLTLPLLVYIFKVDVILATWYTMFIVGLTSAVGSFNYFRRGWVDINKAMAFGIPSMIVVFIFRNWVVPEIPAVLIDTDSFELSLQSFVMLFFALLMILASIMMFKNSKPMESAADTSMNLKMIIINGIMVGGVSGFVGAGGGFLIIPALVVFSNLSMREAVGTSLVIITANSIIGILGKFGDQSLDWCLLMSVTFSTVIGIFVGVNLSSKIDGGKLKPAFGWFVLLMGVYVMIRETLLK